MPGIDSMLKLDMSDMLKGIDTRPRAKRLYKHGHELLSEASCTRADFMQFCFMVETNTWHSQISSDHAVVIIQQLMLDFPEQFKDEEPGLKGV